MTHAEQVASRTLMERNLQLLHDVLARTPVAGRYWLFGGVLLSAVREGEIMLHDAKDADFAVRTEDVVHLHASFASLVEAGFAPSLRFPGAIGTATEYSFRKDDAKFEFFVVGVDAEDRMQWSNYGHRADGTPLHNTLAIPAQPLDELRFLGRTWLKPRDVDIELTALYGDWRTPAPGWSYMDSPNIIARERWDSSTYQDWAAVFPAAGC